MPLSVTYYEYVLTVSVIRHTSACSVLHRQLWPVLGPPYFFHTLSPHAARFSNNNLLNITRFYFIYNFCLKQTSFYEEMSKILSSMYIGLHVKYLLFMSDGNDTFENNLKLSNFMKVRPLGSEFFHADGRTDRHRHDEANGRF